MSDTNKVFVKIRRFDLADNPKSESKVFELHSKTEYNALKPEIHRLCDTSMEEGKVIKLRNKDEVLVPLMNLLNGNSPETYFIIDVSRIHHTTKATTKLQDAYIDAIRRKLENIENRVTQAELLIPQIQMKHQAHMEQTVHDMSTRVAFLNKRIDDLIPPQWKSKMPVTIS